MSAISIAEQLPKLLSEDTLELKLLDKMPDNEYSATEHFRFSVGQVPSSFAAARNNP